MGSTKDIFWYIGKLVILIFVAVVSLIFSNDLFSVLLNAMTFLITILFDVISGAVKVSRSVLSKWTKGVVKGLLLFILAVFLATVILTLYIAQHPDINWVSMEFIIAMMAICAIGAILSDYLVG